MVSCGPSLRSAPRTWLFSRNFSNYPQLSRGSEWRSPGIDRPTMKSRKTLVNFTPGKPAGVKSDPGSMVYNNFEAYLRSSDRDFKHLTQPANDWNIAGVDLGPRRQSRKYGNPSLPLPLVTLSKQKLNKKKRRETSTKYKKLKQFDKYSTIAKNLRIAPFNTALRQNPYALALASPVRMCNLTGIRIPSSCLIEMTIVTDVESNKPMLHPARLTLAAIAAKANKAKYTPEQLRAAESVKDAESPDPAGAASYLTVQRAAVQYLSTRKRWQLQLNQRMREALRARGQNPDDVIWRDNMPDYILEELRIVSLKKLRVLLRNKGSKDKPGLVSSIPGNGSLSWLNRVPDAACVLRLNPEENDRPETDYIPGPATENMITLSASGEEPANEGTGESWLKEERKKSLPIVDLKSMPPPEKSLQLHLPTIAYRNRHIPLYDLKRLMGSPLVEQLIKDTVFSKSKFVVLKMSLATRMVQVWLLHLAAYANEIEDLDEANEGSLS